MRMRHLIVAFCALFCVSLLRAEDHCIGHDRAAALHADGRTFDPKTGRDTRQYAPDAQVDFAHLKLDLRMDDPATKSFACAETRTSKTLGRPVARLGLDAVDLDIHSVTDMSGKPLNFRADDKRLTIPFDPELPPPTDGGIVISYACTDPTDGM